MRPSLRRKLERREAEMEASDRTNRWILIAIVAGFALMALVLFLRNRVPGGPVDINKANTAELQRLPGVGSAMAKEIVKGRPYETPQDLLKVKGIGPKTLDKMLPLVEVDR
ncbi:MAG: helix-hairpin-helix domain-containing protein [Verrucomicrobiales bacterium]|nr:helix-hairpin-helix domain-containing protein [Verrucomicrobiales bacterium]